MGIEPLSGQPPRGRREVINLRLGWVALAIGLGWAAGCTLERRPQAGTDAVRVSEPEQDLENAMNPMPESGPAAVTAGRGGTGNDEPDEPVRNVSVLVECDCDAGCTEPQCIRANGETCERDEQCESDHCQNSHCCETGACCQSVSDCNGGGDGVALVCSNKETCEGTRGQVMCEDFQCISKDGIKDDRGCGPSTEASDCGPYPSVYCNGNREQTPPPCATSCDKDEDCDHEAHCNEGKCRMNVPNGGPCELGRECVSRYCGGGICCEDGHCCRDADDCPSSLYVEEPVCEEPNLCRGTQRRAVCMDFMCAKGPKVDDDSACGPDTLAIMCIGRESQYCNGETEQQAPSCPFF